MSRRPRQGAPRDRFSSRLREAIGRFAEGVHEVAGPADEAALAAAAARLGALPGSLADVYRFADGLWLFHDALRVLPLAEISDRGGGLHVGTVEQALLVCRGDGAILEEDADGDRIRTADDLEEALLVHVARDGLLVDADGEWREVFGPDGELTPAVRRRRNEAARKRSPGGARWLLEAAELDLELDGDEAAALEHLEEAVRLDADAPAPEELRGLLLQPRDAPAGAAALARAAERSGPARRAERAAVAAEAWSRVGDDAARRRFAAIALAAEPAFCARVVGEAEAALESGRLDDADRLAALAAAVGGPQGLSARLRGRTRLRLV